MIQLAAYASLRIAPDELTSAMRAVLEQPLRREGILAKLCITGIVSCIGSGDPHPSLRTAMVWGSPSGARIEVDKVLAEVCTLNSLPMPFDFIASQCGVATVYAARYIERLACGVYMPSGGQLWQQMLSLATCWLEEGRYDRVLCGWVNQADPHDIAQQHASDWLLLGNAAMTDQTLALVQPCINDTPSSRNLPDEEFLPTLQGWIGSQSTQLSVYHRAFQRP